MTSKQLLDILITFKHASHIPVRDIMSQSSDPYLLAFLTPRAPPSPEHPPFPLTFRTTTKRHTRDPQWEEAWHLGGMPLEGFDLVLKLFDEDKPRDLDNGLGIAELSVNENLPPTGEDGKPGEPRMHELKIKKRKANRQTYAATYLVAWCNRDFKRQRGRVLPPHSYLTIGNNIDSKPWQVNVYKELSLCIGPNEMECTCFSNDCISLSYQYLTLGPSSWHPTPC